MKETIEMHIGISTDEIIRVSQSRHKWIINKHPLIDLNMSRIDCINYMKGEYGELPPKSSCYFCPYHNNTYWNTMKKYQPAEFEKACQFDEEIRHMPMVDGELYIHRSMKPLRSIDFENEPVDIELFGEDCVGMCGV